MRAPLLLLPFLAACAAAPLDPTAPCRGEGLTQRAITLPARWVGDYPLLETYIDGHGPYRFILDTGAAICALAPHLAGMGVGAQVGRMNVRDSGGRMRHAQEWREVSLAFGPVRFPRVAAAVFDLEALAAALGEPIDGIAGYPLFHDCLLTLDYPGAAVRLAAGSLPPADGGDLVPLHTDPLPHLDLRLGDYDQRVLIDSGSLETLALDHWPPHLEFRSPPVPLTAGVALHGGVRIEEVGRLLGEVRLGRHVLDELIVQSCAEGRRLGTGVLRHFVLTLDGRGGVARLERDALAPIHMDPVVGTGMVFDVRPGHWRVIAVVPGSPADQARVRVGDRVVAVDGVPVHRLAAASDWYWGKRLVFTFERDGRKERAAIEAAPLVP